MDNATFLIPNGVRVRDLITNFEGLVTGRADYITGCNQYLVQPSVKEDGSAVDPRWLDEHRLQVTDPRVLVLPTPAAEDRPGACDSAPTK